MVSYRRHIVAMEQNSNSAREHTLSRKNDHLRDGLPRRIWDMELLKVWRSKDRRPILIDRYDREGCVLTRHFRADPAGTIKKPNPDDSVAQLNHSTSLKESSRQISFLKQQRKGGFPGQNER